MEIKTIAVREIRNLGNFQSRTAEAIAHLNEGDNPKEAMQKLVNFVHEELYPDNETSQNTEKPAYKEPVPPSPVPVVKEKLPLPSGDKDEDGIPF